MSVQTDALKNSIIHWEENLSRVREKTVPHIDSDDCPCCNIWFDNECQGCPISEYVGAIECKHTPYGDVSRQCNILSRRSEDLYEWKVLESFIEKEIEFLRKVLHELDPHASDDQEPHEEPMNKQLITRIEQLFFAQLQTKTGWGRNEIMEIYRASVNEALLELIDERR